MHEHGSSQEGMKCLALFQMAFFFIIAFGKSVVLLEVAVRFFSKDVALVAEACFCRAGQATSDLLS